VIAYGALAVSVDSSFGSGINGRLFYVIICILAAIIVWLIGRGIRYILAGT